MLCYSHGLILQRSFRFTRFEAKVFLTGALRCFEGAPERIMVDDANVIRLCGNGRDTVPAPEMAAFAYRFGFVFVAHAPGNAKPNRSLGNAVPEELYARERGKLHPLPVFIPEPERVEIDEGDQTVFHERVLLPLDQRVQLPAHRPPRGEKVRLTRELDEERALSAILPDIAPFVAALKKHGRKAPGFPLRRPLKLAHNYPHDAQRAEWHARQEESLAWRIKTAALPESFTLETFPFAAQPGVHRRRIRSFASVDFIPRAENIVFIGKPGVGKTGLAIGILLEALENGCRGRFARPLPPGSPLTVRSLASFLPVVEALLASALDDAYRRSLARPRRPRRLVHHPLPRRLLYSFAWLTSDEQEWHLSRERRRTPILPSAAER